MLPYMCGIFKGFSCERMFFSGPITEPSPVLAFADVSALVPPPTPLHSLYTHPLTARRRQWQRSAGGDGAFALTPVPMKRQ